MPNLEYFPDRPLLHKIRPMLSMGFLFKSAYMKQTSLKSLTIRNKKLEERLYRYELDNTIKNVHVFDQAQYTLTDPIEVADRLLILLSVAFTAYNFDQSEKVMDWLKNEELWASVSEKEKEFFRNPDPEDEEKQGLSWRFESAFILAWSLDKVQAPNPERECTEEQVKDFFNHVPPVGSNTEAFYHRLQYRSVEEVIDETLFYEIAARYFKDIEAKHKENVSSIHKKACFERHLALNWLRSTEEKASWDDIV